MTDHRTNNDIKNIQNRTNGTKWMKDRITDKVIGGINKQKKNKQ